MTEKIIRQGFGYKPTDYDVNFKEIREFSEQHKKNKNLVKEILEGWDVATNSDVLLYFEFLKIKFEDIRITSTPGKEGDIIIRIPKNQLLFLTPPESVSRARRSLNKLGIGLPTLQSVFISRMRRQRTMRKYFRGVK